MTKEMEMQRQVRKDVKRLETVTATMKEILAYLEQGHTVMDVENEYGEKMDEADKLLCDVCFGN